MSRPRAFDGVCMGCPRGGKTIGDRRFGRERQGKVSLRWGEWWFGSSEGTRGMGFQGGWHSLRNGWPWRGRLRTRWGRHDSVWLRCWSKRRECDREWQDEQRIYGCVVDILCASWSNAKGKSILREGNFTTNIDTSCCPIHTPIAFHIGRVAKEYARH